MSRSGAAHAPDHPGAIEFFAGMGLVRRALEQINPDSPSSHVVWQTLRANDFDPLKERLYRNTFADHEETFLPGDVAAIDPGDLPASDLWTASFPCTDLSLAGRGAGIHAGQSGAVWSMLHLLEGTPPTDRPRHILFENVLGLLTSHQGADFAALVSTISELGYGLDAMCVDARHFVPQSRPRLFIIAERLDLTDRRPIDPNECSATEARPQRLIEAMRRNPNVQWLLRDLPALPQRAHALDDIVTDPAEDSELWWSSDRVTYFRNQVHPGHRRQLEQMIDGERVMYATAFRRVRAFPDADDANAAHTKRSVVEIRTDGMAGCLRTPKGGSAKQILVRAGGGNLAVRHLTPIECARLQGAHQLPEGFSANELLFGLGDAVCVPAVRWVLDRMTAPVVRTNAPQLRSSLFTTTN